MVSAALNGNLSALLLVLALGHRHGKHAIVELRSNFIGINRVRQSQSAQERAVGALRQVIVLLFIFFIELLLGANGEYVVHKRHINVALAHAWQVGANPHLVIGFADIDARHHWAALQRTILHPIAGPAVKYIIEQTGHLSMQRKEWMPKVALQETA